MSHIKTFKTTSKAQISKLKKTIKSSAHSHADKTRFFDTTLMIFTAIKYISLEEVLFKNIFHDCVCVCGI